MRGRRAARRSCSIHGDNGCENQGEAGGRTRADEKRDVERELVHDTCCLDEDPDGAAGAGESKVVDLMAALEESLAAFKVSRIPRSVPAPDTSALLHRAADIVGERGLAKRCHVTADGRVDVYRAIDEAMFEQVGITWCHPEAPYFVERARDALIGELEHRDEHLAEFPALWQDEPHVTSATVVSVLRSAAEAS